MTAAGFVAASNLVTEEDANDFLRAWVTELPVHRGRGQYLVGNGRIHEQFFWSGAKHGQERRFTLWMEPVISMGAIARLHLDLGWPLSRLSAQSPEGAFNLLAAAEDARIVIAGEVKKTIAEIDSLARLMTAYCADPQAAEPKPGSSRNAYRKVVALRKSGAPMLLLVGPARHERVFEVNHDTNGQIMLAEGNQACLLHDRWEQHVP